MKLIFCIQINTKVAYKLISTLWAPRNALGTKVGCKVILSLLISMMKHSQVTQSNIFANLCNISKKLGMELFLHADEHQSFYKLALSFLMETAN